MSNRTFAEMMDTHMKEHIKAMEEDIVKHILTPSPLFTGMGWLESAQQKQDRLAVIQQYKEDRQRIRANAVEAIQNNGVVVADPAVIIRLLDDAESWIAEEEESKNSAPPEVPDFAVRVPTGTATVVFVSDYGKVTQVEWME